MIQKIKSTTQKQSQHPKINTTNTTGTQQQQIDIQQKLD
jgi:hypothetical protein